MERLTPKYVTTDFENVEKSTLKYCKGQIPMFAGRSVLDYIHRLAELEDKIEDGTLWETPCKFEITIYWVDNRFPKIAEIEEIKTVVMLDEDRATISQYNFGKESFFTREEAEKRLEENMRMTDKRKSNAIGTDKVLRGIEYRPTDEVRKETAKDILLQLAQFRAISPAFSATWNWLAEKYGV